MNMKLEFPKDTRDNTERQYWHLIEKRYPAYKEFWEEFIGVRVKKNVLYPYGIKKNGRILLKESEEYEHYYKICMCHYCIFCDIAIAGEELTDIQKTFKRNISLHHWRHFEHFFFRLDSVRDRFEKILISARILCSQNNKKWTITNLTTDHNLNNTYKNWYDNVSTIRNSTIHWARLGSCAPFQIPKDIPSLLKQHKKTHKKKSNQKDNQNALWYIFHGLPQRDLISTIDYMQKYYEDMFEWLQPLESTLIERLKIGLQKAGISIDDEYEHECKNGSNNRSYDLNAVFYISERAGSGMGFSANDNDCPTDDDDNPQAPTS